MDVTLRLVGKYGVHDTTTVRIAAAAGVSAPTLYRSFRNRKDILLACTSVVHDRAMNVVNSSQNPNVIERLREIGVYHGEHLSNKKTGFVEFLFQFALAPANLKLRERTRAIHLAVHERLAAMIEEGKAQGSILDDVDPIDTAWRIISFFWINDVSFLMRADEFRSRGLSMQALESILDEIAARPRG